ncbi:NAD(P)-dependent alcohol dehydrogenase [Microbacterium sp. NPDC055903]
MSQTMTAWLGREYGAASATVPEELTIPVPGQGQVLLRIHATALNAGDVRIMRGDPLLVRPVFGLTRPRQPVRGMDVVGTVVGVGPGVLGAEVGERVVAELAGGGGLAAYATVDERRVVPVPPGVSSEDASCLPIAAGTAWQALDLAGVGIGGAAGRVLIIGASGGVGTFAVQLAALRGAEVWASCGDRNARLVERLGAGHVFDHRTAGIEGLEQGGFDAVIDIAGNLPLRSLQRLARDGGTVVLAGGDGGHVLGPVPRMLRAALLSLGSRRRIRPLAATARPEILAKLLELVGDRAIVPVIEEVVPFAEAGAALARIEAGHVVGKLVVTSAM